MNKKYAATIIGTVVTVICWALTYTFIFPVLTIIPIGLPLELLFSGGGYSGTSFKVLLSLIVLFLLTISWFYKRIKVVRDENKKLNVYWIISFFSMQLVIIHPLVFYIWATLNSSKAGDGQFMFAVVETFPISSFSFVVLGLLIDGVMNKKSPKGTGSHSKNVS